MLRRVISIYCCFAFSRCLSWRSLVWKDMGFLVQLSRLGTSPNIRWLRLSTPLEFTSEAACRKKRELIALTFLVFSCSSALVTFGPLAAVVSQGPCCLCALLYVGYLVDPASCHMLVSKIKPCMCKYKLLCTVKLRMAH